MDNQEENFDNTEPTGQPEKEGKITVNKPKSRVKKVVFWISGLFLFLLIAIPLILNFYAYRIFGDTVQQIVKKETGGMYDFNYRKIRFNLFKSDLVIYDLSIFSDTSVQDRDTLGNTNHHKLVELKIPELHFAGFGIYNVLRKKELVINRFYIGQPGLKLHIPGPKRNIIVGIDSLSNRDLNQRTLHVYLKDYLTLLKIINFELNNGYLEIIRGNADSTESIKINNISLLLSNFQVDSLSNQTLDRLFLSDSLGISLKSGHFEFLGKSHNLTFNNIKLSIDDRTIEIEGLVVKPDSSRADYDEHGWVELTVPLVKLTGFDFQSFIDKKLLVSEIIINEPDILYHPAKGEERAKFDRKKFERQIFEELSKLFYPIEVGEILINSANFKIDGFESESLEDFYLPDVTLYLHNLKIDSASFDTRSPQFFVDDVRLILNEQEFFLKKSARHIKIGYFDLDSRTSQLELCDVLIEGYRKNAQSTDLNLQIPVLELQGENFKQDFLENKLHVLTLDIQEPTLTIHAGDGTFSDPNRPDIYFLYREISDFLTELSVASCKIDGGKFDFGKSDGIFTDQFSSPNISMVVTDFLLNKDASKNQNKVFYSSGIEINASNLAVMAPDSIHQLFFDKLMINTKDSLMNISGLHIDSLKSVAGKPFFLKDKDRLKLDVNDIVLKGIDFIALYYHHFIEVNNVEISNPSGYFQDVLADQSRQKMERNFLPDFQIAHLKLNNGNFYVQEFPGKSSKKIAFNGLTLSIDCLQPTLPGKTNKIEAENIELSSENLAINLPDNSYSIEMSKLKISSIDSLISATDLIWQPRNPAPENENFIVRAKVPGFSVSGIAIGELYEKNILQAGAIHFEKPSYRLIFTKQVSNREKLLLKGDVIREQILKTFKSVDIKQFSMNNADLEVFGGSTFGTRELLLGDFDLAINSFFVDSASNMTNPNLFFASDIRFSARRPIKASSGEDFDVSLGNLSGSTKDGFIKAESIIVNGRGLNQKQKQQQKVSDVEIVLKNLDMKGIDFYKLLTQRKLKMERINVDEPDLWLTREFVPGLQKTKVNNEIDLFKLISDQLFEIQVANVEIADASLKVQDHKGKNTEAFQLNRIDAGFKNILVDSANKVFGDKFLYSDIFNLKISDYSYLTPDSLYLLGAAGIRFSNKNMAITIDSGFMAPQFDEEVFAAKVGHQTDRFQWVFDSAYLEHIRIPELLSQNRVSISKATFYQFIGDDYRDKTFNLLPDHYTSLPVSGIRSLPFVFMLDTLKLENSRIQYREYVPPAIEPGIIWFDGLTLEGKNITNDSTIIARDSIMKFFAKAKLMNEASLEFSVKFDLKSPRNEFRASGVLNELDLTSMNPFLENVAFIKIKKGTNNLLTFNFDGDNDVARGELFFNYDKLSIRLIDKKTMDVRGFGESVASFIANNFIIRSDNPKYAIFFRKGKIYFERNNQKSFFNYVAKSILSGVLSTIKGGNKERKENRRKRRLETQSRPEARLNEEDSFRLKFNNQLTI